MPRTSAPRRSADAGAGAPPTAVTSAATASRSAASPPSFTVSRHRRSGGNSLSTTAPWYAGAPRPASSPHIASKYGTVLWQKMQVWLQTPPARRPGRSLTSTE